MCRISVSSKRPNMGKIAGFFVMICALSQADRAFSIQCNQCRSTKSWEDCTKNQIKVNCSIVYNRCLTFHQVHPLPNGHYTHEYEKACYHDRSCGQCNENGLDKWCDMDCCNTTLCNNGVTHRESNEVKRNLLQPTEKEKKPKILECYDCSSPFSWEDCIKNQTLMKCPAILDVCTTYHRVLTLHSGNQEHEYKKGCWHSDSCSNELCRETDTDVKGTWCDMRCCTSSGCNKPGINVKSAFVKYVSESESIIIKASSLYVMIATAVVFVSGVF